MLKKSRKIISVLVAIVLLFNLSFSYSTAIIAPETVVTSKNKISEELAIAMETMDDDDTVSVMVWFEDIDLDAVNAVAEKNIGYTQADVQKAEKAILEIDSSVFELEGIAYANAINNYREVTKEERFAVLEMQNNLIDTKRQVAKEHYLRYNQTQVANLNVSRNKITHISCFSPVAFVTLNIKQILDLAKKDCVQLLGYCNNSIPTEDFAYALPAVYANYTRDTLGFDGYGVKVGIFDVGAVGSHSELSSSTITKLDPSGATESPHSTGVARIIAGTNGVAPNASLYSTSTDSIYIALEELLSYGVSVINISLHYNRGTAYYDDMERWIDHIAYQHGVTIVKSASNLGISTTIPTPGLAYNIITVGGTNTLNTSNRSDDIMYADSCSGNGGTAGCAKPDFLAPANVAGYVGTSFSTPIVTGIIAQMIEYKPTLATNPALIKAILTVSTDKKVLPGASPAVSEEWAGTITAQQGAGQVNAKNAMATLGKNRYAVGTMSSGTISKTFSVSSSDSWIRYSVAWTRRNTASGTHTSSSSTAAIAPNLKLQVYNPNNTSMGLSNIPTSSVELVHFTVGTTGTHTAKITRMDSGKNTFDYAVAWH